MNMTDEILNSWTDADECLADKIEKVETDYVKSENHIKVEFGSQTLAAGLFDVVYKYMIPEGKHAIIVSGYSYGNRSADVVTTAVYYDANYIHFAGNCKTSGTINPTVWLVII